MLLRLTSSTLALLMMTAPAAFSLTADQVWDTWQTYLGEYGYEVAVGAREEAGGDLTLRDVVLTMAVPEGDMTTTVTVPVIRMTPTGGADIRSEFPEKMTFRTAGTDSDGDAVLVEGELDATGAETISREQGEGQEDSITLPEGTLALTRVSIGDASMGETPLTVVVRQLQSTSLYGGGADMRTALAAEGADISFDFADPEGEGRVTGQGRLGALQFASQAGFPAGHNSKTPAALVDAMRAGAAMTGNGTIASAEFSMDAAGSNGEQMQMQAGGGPVSIDFGLDGGRLTYQADASDVAYAFSGSELPLPVDVRLDSVSVDLQFPLLAEDAAQPFKLGYSIAGLAVNDEVWAMVDAQGAFPRDPADLDIDLTGELILHQDLLTMAEDGDAAMAETPLVPVSLVLNQFALVAVGASITAEGDLRFPEPGNFELMAGKLSARYQGLNTLLDRVVEAGLVSADEVGGARMMLMMFAKPVEGAEDTLETHLEVNEAQEIYANGVRIQ